MSLKKQKHTTGKFTSLKKQKRKRFSKNLTSKTFRNTSGKKTNSSRSTPPGKFTSLRKTKTKTFLKKSNIKNISQHFRTKNKTLFAFSKSLQLFLFPEMCTSSFSDNISLTSSIVAEWLGWTVGKCVL